MSVFFVAAQLLLATLALATSYAWLMSILKKEVSSSWVRTEVLLTALCTLGSLLFFFTLQTSGVMSTVAWLSATVAGLNAVAATIGAYKDDPSSELLKKVLLMFGAVTFTTLASYLLSSIYLLSLM